MIRNEQWHYHADPVGYGSGTDRCRNLVAAGTCTLTWKGQT
jgi:hypothetical protein